MALPGWSVRNIKRVENRWRLEVRGGTVRDWTVVYTTSDVPPQTDHKQFTKGRLPESGTYRLTSSQRDLLSKIALEMGCTMDEAVTRLLSQNAS